MPTAGEGLLGKGSESLPHELGGLEVHGVGCEDRLKIFLYFSYPAWPRIGERIPRVGLYVQGSRIENYVQWHLLPLIRQLSGHGLSLQCFLLPKYASVH